MKSIEKYCYDSLLKLTHVLLDIINSLPNAEEIKETKEYQDAYNNFYDNVNKYFKKRLEKQKKIVKGAKTE
jgi:hypothetical protein